MPKKLTTEEFIQKAINVHGDRYDYSDVIYMGSHTKIKIRCKVHGIFLQTPASHLSGRSCKECAYESFRFTTEEFITRAVNVHGDKYDYSDVIYINDATKVKIKCFNHGIFLQTPNAHFNQGHGCKECANENKVMTQEEFIQKATNVHGDKYDYSDVVYMGSFKKIKIRCKEHGIFVQLPSSHLSVSSCPKCNIGGIPKERFISIGKDKECTFYLINCYNDNESFYKIGITTKTIKERFRDKERMPYNYTILKEYKSSASGVWYIENSLKENLKSFYTPCIHFNGAGAECFTDLKEIECTLNEVVYNVKF